MDFSIVVWYIENLQQFLLYFQSMVSYSHRIYTYLFQISSPDTKRISLRMAASNEVLPLPLFPTITVSLPINSHIQTVADKFIGYKDALANKWLSFAAGSGFECIIPICSFWLMIFISFTASVRTKKNHLNILFNDKIGQFHEINAHCSHECVKWNFDKLLCNIKCSIVSSAIQLKKWLDLKLHFINEDKFRSNCAISIGIIRFAIEFNNKMEWERAMIYYTIRLYGNMGK